MINKNNMNSSCQLVVVVGGFGITNLLLQFFLILFGKFRGSLKVQVCVWGFNSLYTTLTWVWIQIVREIPKSMTAMMRLSHRCHQLAGCWVWSSLTSGSPSEERAYLPPWCQPSLRGGLIYIASISQNQSVSHHQQEHQHVQGDQRSLKDVNPKGKAMMSVTKQQLQTDHKNVNLGKPTRLDIPPILKGKNKEKPWEKSRHRWQNWVLLYDN